jgi:hypothetical protein
VHNEEGTSSLWRRLRAAWANHRGCLQSVASRQGVRNVYVFEFELVGGVDNVLELYGRLYVLTFSIRVGIPTMKRSPVHQQQLRRAMYMYIVGYTV